MAEYRFHCDTAEAAVVSFRMEDSLSQPYTLRLLLHQREGEPPPFESLLGKGATLRIATLTQPTVRSVHGMVVGARDVGPTHDGYLYELDVGPPLLRAKYRRRSRIFHHKTMRQIVEAVLLDGYVQPRTAAASEDGGLQLDDAFTAPRALLAWSLHDVSRIDDAKVRPYCVQYEESDLAFVSRLLEHEGIAYHFEHDSTAVTMVLADHDGGRPRLASSLGSNLLGRHVESVQVGHRMRPKKVTMNAFNWERPKQDMQVESGAGEALIVATTGSYTQPHDHGAALAHTMLERLRSDARVATIVGSCRLLAAGVVFAVGHVRQTHAGEYLATKVVMQGRAEGELPPGAWVETAALKESFTVEAQCVRRGESGAAEESRFRPPRRTPRPRIVGVQTAIVTDDPDTRGAEIHVGGPEGNENGCVRVRFHWDTETDRHQREPTSCWVRVSQTFAGAGGGAVWHPRVGTEVIVEHIDGDPQRPIVTGRLYNGEQQPPWLGQGAATVSGFHTQSSPGGDKHNALTFDDTAGSENISLHAGHDWHSTSGNDRTEDIGNNSASTVAVHRTEKTGGNRQAQVSGDNEDVVEGNDSLTVNGDQSWTVAGTQTHTIAGDRELAVAGAHGVCTGPETYTVKGAQAVAVTGAQEVSVGASRTLAVAGAITTTAGASYRLGAPVVVVKAPLHTVEADVATVQASATINLLAGAAATLQGVAVAVTAAGELVLSGGGSAIRISGAGIEITGGAIKIAGGSVDITGGVVKVN